jgi:putative nucleotidyltransferase with HDIG domain
MMDERILVVDDDRLLLDALVRELGRRFHLDTATSAEEALEKLRRNGPYAVILTDLHMPGTDGITLLDEVRRHWPDTVRMMFTSWADREKVIEALNTGYLYRFLDKPCSRDTMACVLRDALDQHQRMLAARELEAVKKQKEALEKVVMGFTRLVEARDPYTAGHQKRVAELSCALARQLGLSEEKTDRIRLAALTHDIGKIYVPAEFLNRPGALTEIEFNVIRLHPQVGFEILQPLDLDGPISEFVLQHHERLNGSGYPQGLRGDQIHLEAKVLAVADVVEAMSSHRPYRPALGLERALAEVEAGRGVTFEPEVVDACLDLFRVGKFPLP